MVQPWLLEFQNSESQIAKLVSIAQNSFNKKNTDLLLLANRLKVGGEKQIKSVMDTPKINGDELIFFTLLFQNAMQPKNHQRREAVTQKIYVEVNDREIATKYLTNILTSNLRNEISGRESQIISSLQQSLSSETASLFYQAPNIYLAAAVLKCHDFFNGRGDVSQVLRMFKKSKEVLPFPKEKLQLLQMGTFFGVNLYSDEFKDYPDRFPISRIKLFNIWLSMVRNGKKMSTGDFIQSFPEYANRIAIWDQCIDEEGRPNLDRKKFGEYIKTAQKKRKDNKAVK